MKTNKLFFLFSILLSMLSTNALAYDFAVKNANGVMIYYNYANNKKEASVTYNKENRASYSGSVVIPKEVTYEKKKLKVTKIGYNAFYNCDKLTSVTIPNSVIEIGESAFESCESLKSITIPNSVTSIGEEAFEFCYRLKSITIPNSVTSIGKSAFCRCYSLTTVTVPNSVKEISSCTFMECINLTSVTIPNSVKAIWGKTFEECTSLKSITIPNSVTSIQSELLRRCTSLTSVTIPNSVTLIRLCAFIDCTSLTSITIPSSVKEIEFAAFYRCKNLKNVISKIVSPFPIEDDTFSDETYSKAPLYVPKGTVAKYKTTQGWKNFKNIVEEGTTTGIDDVETENTLNTSNAIYDINGKRLPVTSLDELPSGLYIINGKKVVK